MEALIYTEADGTLGFGNYTLEEKAKADGFAHEGDLYKIKTFSEITKLERNGKLVYESVPGTAVNGFTADDREVAFQVKGKEAARVTLELEPEKEYKIFIDGVQAGRMKTNLGGKLVFSVELGGEAVKVKVVKL